MSQPREKCQHCTRNDVVWLVLDSRRHIYHHVEGEEVTTTRQQDGYFLCHTCKKALVKRKTAQRKLSFIPWSSGDE